MKYLRYATVILVMTFALVQMVEAKRRKTSEENERGTAVGHRPNRGIVDLIPKILKPLHKNFLSTLLVTVGYVRQAAQFVFGSAPNQHLDRRWQELLKYDLHAIKAIEMFLERELAKDTLQFIKDVPSLERYLNALIHSAQKLEKSYFKHGEKIKQLLRDTQEEYNNINDYDLLSGIVERVYITLGGKEEELHLSKQLMPLWERLTWTSTKVCYLGGLVTLLELSLTHASINEEFQVDVAALKALCDE